MIVYSFDSFKRTSKGYGTLSAQIVPLWGVFNMAPHCITSVTLTQDFCSILSVQACAQHPLSDAHECAWEACRAFTSLLQLGWVRHM